MEFLFIPAVLLPFLPHILTALGLIGGSIASKNAVDRMNRYNDPRAQLQRLNAAGLPFAAYAAGQSGSQSQLPDTSGIGQAGQALGNYFVSRNQMAMYDNLREDLRNKKYLNDLLGEEWKFGMSEAEGYMGGSNAYNKAKLDMTMKEAANTLQTNAATVSAIETGIKEAQFTSGNLAKAADAQLEKLMIELDILKIGKDRAGEELDNLKAYSAAKRKLISTMEKGGLSLAEALILLVLESKL